MNTDKLLELIECGRFDALEQQWQAVVEQRDGPVDELLKVVKAVVDAERPDQAELMAWTWLIEYRNRVDARAALELAYGLLELVPQSDQLREDVSQLYSASYGDRSGAVVAASGIESGQPAERALRVLRICASVEPGGFVVERTENRAYEVAGFDVGQGLFSLVRGGDRIAIGARDLAYHYQPTGAEDFRVLDQLNPERLAELMGDDPATVVLGVVISRGGEATTDEIRDTLCPQHLTESGWNKWFGSARTVLRRSGRIRFEGRSPVTLVYDPKAKGPADHLAEQLAEAYEPLKIWPLLRSYLREEPTDTSPVATAVKRLEQWIGHHKRDDPGTALQAAAVLERLGERLSAAGAEPGSSQVAAVLRDSSEPLQALAALPDAQLWQAALTAVRRDLPDEWVRLYTEALAVAPAAICDQVGEALLEAGQAATLQTAIDLALERPGRHFGTLVWLWQGPKIDAIAVVSRSGRVELLLRMLAALDELGRPAPEQRSFAQSARTKLRSAITAKKLERLKQCLPEVGEPAMAAALRRQIERCSGLSPAAKQDILRAVADKFPQLWALPSVQPWDDPNVLYVTAGGLERKQGELDEIINVKMRDNSRAIGEAAARGDLSENSEYQFALEERDLLRARVAQIQSQMAMARVMIAADVATDEVGIGSRVTLKSTKDDSNLQITIMGPWESDVEKGILNYQAPVCRKLLGLKPGQTAELNLQGEPEQYRVEAISVGIQ